MSHLKLHRRGGPTSAIGKKRSSQNAHRHGLFAAQFSFSGADEIEFTRLTVDLREAFKPNNSLLELIFQDVVACAWRMRIALRREQQELRRQFTFENEESLQEPSGVRASFPNRLKVGHSPEDIKLLDRLHNSIKVGGRLPLDLEEPVTQAFGPELWKMLTQWAPLDPMSVWVARLYMSAIEREEIYGSESPKPNLTPEEKKQILDANALREIELICKFIQAYKNLLLTAPRSAEKGSMVLEGRESRLDLFIRYSTTARRDFYRSVREFKEAMVFNGSSSRLTCSPDLG